VAPTATLTGLKDTLLTTVSSVPVTPGWGSVAGGGVTTTGGVGGVVPVGASMVPLSVPTEVLPQAANNGSAHTPARSK
jgi:hypothetical protein